MLYPPEALAVMMHFSWIAALTLLLLSSSTTALASPSPSRTAAARPPSHSLVTPPGTQALIDWTHAAIVSFYPNRTDWATGFDASFDASLVATFASPALTQAADTTVYNYTGFKAFYTGIYEELSAKVKRAVIEFGDTTATPFSDDDLGGYVYLTGLEYGTYKNGTPTTAGRDGAFIHVKDFGGTRRIVEFRDSSNWNP